MNDHLVNLFLNRQFYGLRSEVRTKGGSHVMCDKALGRQQKHHIDVTAKGISQYPVVYNSESGIASNAP